MNERVHRYLDGELRLEALTPEELQETATCEHIVNETRSAYQSVAAPDLTAQIMARLPAQSQKMTAPKRTSDRAVHVPIVNFFRHTLQRLWAPRLVRFRPVYGILAAVTFLVILVLSEARSLRIVNTSARKVDSSQVVHKVFVQFRLDAPKASAVRLAGSFTGWEATYTLQQVSSGVWSILIPLEPGVHEYAFIVDGGKWTPDPAAPEVDDGFGGVNSRLSVLLPNGDSRL